MPVELPLTGINQPVPSRSLPLSKTVRLIEFSNNTFGIRFGRFFFEYLDLTTGHTKSTNTKKDINFDNTCTSYNKCEVLKLYIRIIEENRPKDSPLVDKVLYKY